MTHTPGPWRLDNNIAYGWKTNPFSITVRKRGVHSTTVANIPAKQTISRDDAEANARLIAAAPELLEAIQTALRGWEAEFEYLAKRTPVWVTQARAAIAKATGSHQ